MLDVSGILLYDWSRDWRKVKLASFSRNPTGFITPHSPSHAVVLFPKTHVELYFTFDPPASDSILGMIAYKACCKYVLYDLRSPPSLLQLVKQVLQRLPVLLIALGLVNNLFPILLCPVIECLVTAVGH